MGTQKRSPVPKGYIEIGYIRRAHGVKGHILVRTHNAESETLAKGLQVTLLDDEGNRQERQVVFIALAGTDLRLGLQNISTRHQAERLKGCRLIIPLKELPDVEEGEFYHHQLIGLSVLDSDGVKIGTLTEIFETAAHDIYQIAGGKVGELMIPAVSRYVQRIDIEAQEIRVTHIDELED